MARYYFSTYDGGFYPDDEGIELLDDQAARAEAMQSLPEIAQELIRADKSDVQALTIMVWDSEKEPLYSATLSFAGTWIKRDR